MKKFKTITATFIMLALLCLLAVSCDSDKTVTGNGSLVAVSFDNMQSAKSLSSSHLDFDGSQLYWKYAARKADSTGFDAGQTGTGAFEESEAKWVREGSSGLKEGTTSYRVPGFSQGLWNFKLFGYSDAAGTNLVYSGETTNPVSLAKEGNHLVSVTVSPASEGNGTLKISKDITLANIANSTSNPNTVLKRYYRYGYVGTSAEPSSWENGYTEFGTTDDVTLSVLAGRCKVEVLYQIEETGQAAIEVSVGSTYATIFTGLETVVSGTLEEGSTYADFNVTDNTNTTSVNLD